MRISSRVVGALIAVVLVGGCTSEGSGDEPARSDTYELTNDTPPAQGDVDQVVWGLPFGEPSSLDPIKAADASSTVVVVNLCDTLLTRDAELAVQPGLATAWEWVDETTLKLTLRDDATFWDGTPVTAEDVAYSLRRSADPKAQSVHVSYLDRVEGVDATGPHEVTVALTRPDSLLIDGLAGLPGAVVSQAAAEAAGADFGALDGGFMCSGPYQVENWASGDSLRIASSGSWWGGKPHVSTIEFRFVTDPSTLTAALASGEIDGAMTLTAAQAPSLQDVPAGTLYAADHTVNLGITPMTSEGPAGDARVRQAIDLSINKQEFVDNVLNGTGGLTKSATPPMMWSGDPAADTYQAGYDALPEPEYDLDKAKALIEEAGAGGSTVIVAVQAGDRLSEQAATVMQDAATDIGLKVEVKKLQANEFFGIFFDPTKREGLDFSIFVDGPAIPRPLAYMPSYLLPDGLYNWTGYSDDQVTQALDAARATTDPTESAQGFVDAQAIYETEKLRITLSSIYQQTFLSKDLTGVPISIGFISMPWAAYLGAR